MKILAVIPARYHSKRFPGKPLVKIAGISMIERVYRQVRQADCFSRIIVATDDSRIKQEVTRFGGEALMTSPDHISGTSRICEVLSRVKADGVINIQGDEPMVSSELIRNMHASLQNGKNKIISSFFYNKNYEEFQSSHVVKVVKDYMNFALYFSRAPIPYASQENFHGFCHHVGIYGYLGSALQDIMNLKSSYLQSTENLEQLKFLENGDRIFLIESPARSYGVDVLADLDHIEKLLQGVNNE